MGTAKGEEGELPRVSEPYVTGMPEYLTSGSEDRLKARIRRESFVYNNAMQAVRFNTEYEWVEAEEKYRLVPYYDPQTGQQSTRSEFYAYSATTTYDAGPAWPQPGSSFERVTFLRWVGDYHSPADPTGWHTIHVYELDDNDLREETYAEARE